MKYCKKCGKELIDEAVICPACGFSVEEPVTAATASDVAVPVKKKSPVKRIIIISVSVFGIILLALAAFVLLYHNKIIELSDIKQYDRFSAIVKFGYPDVIRDHSFTYDNVDFYGANINEMKIEFETFQTHTVVTLIIDNRDDFNTAWDAIKEKWSLIDVQDFSESASEAINCEVECFQYTYSNNNFYVDVNYHSGTPDYDADRCLFFVQNSDK